MPLRLAAALLVSLAASKAQSQKPLPEPVARGMQLARQGQYQQAEQVLKLFAEGFGPSLGKPES